MSPKETVPKGLSLFSRIHCFTWNYANTAQNVQSFCTRMSHLLFPFIPVPVLADPLSSPFFRVREIAPLPPSSFTRSGDQPCAYLHACRSKKRRGRRSKSCCFCFPLPFLSILCLSDARRKKAFFPFFLFLFSFFVELALLFSSPSDHFAYKKFFLPPPPSLPRNSDTATATATRPERHNFFFLPSPWVPFPPPSAIFRPTPVSRLLFFFRSSDDERRRRHTHFFATTVSLSQRK